VWAGVLAYTFQIYCDFSGYSDMAIGVARMIGYDLPENFHMPYLSGNVAEFWRRWHITLSSWLRDYLYIPLGGNRSGVVRTNINLLLTMVLGGLWHGASWNFVVWGGLHGLALIAHRSWHARGLRMGRSAGTLLTFFFVMLCWVPFRSTSFETTRLIFVRLFGGDDGGQGALWYPSVLLGATLVLAATHAIGVWVDRVSIPAIGDSRDVPLWVFFDISLATRPLSGRGLVFGGRTMGGSFLLTVWVLGLFYFASVNATPFIYFQF
jgi:alginate O-acetyltransferase complex protein AlgI